MEWYYADETDQQISFQEEEFKGLVEVGAIKSDTLVWNSTMPDWKKASLVQPMLFGPVAGGPPPVSGSVAPPLNVAPSYQATAPPGADGLGIASLVCGILSILMSCGYGIGLIPGIAAIICGHMSKKRAMEISPTSSSGVTMAGLIMGYIGSAISLIMGIGMIAMIVYAISTEGVNLE
ncbi:MAG: GYF domain-containing protein [Verrucomicrobiales bacterium]|nr:GYF domain-containing protein [Verrucomicrobiales bacterium]